MKKSELVSLLLQAGAESVRIVQESGMTITASFVMDRESFARSIEPSCDNPQSTVKMELRGIQKADGERQGNATRRGLYRYEILVFKF